MAFPKPTPEKVQEGGLLFERDGSSSLVDQALTPLFLQHPDNTDPASVLLKVAALNSLYSTNIYAVVKVARQIVACDVDRLIRSGDPDVVERIGRVQFDGKERNNYSFASKYCWWHNHADYPIYDSYVDESLWHYMQEYPFSKHKNRKDMYTYCKFKEIIDDFRKAFSLEEFTLKQIDMFLYYASEIPA